MASFANLIRRHRAPLAALAVGLAVGALLGRHPGVMWVLAVVVAASIFLPATSRPAEENEARRAPPHAGKTAPLVPPTRRFDNSSLVPAPTRQIPTIPEALSPTDWKALREIHETETGESLTQLLLLFRKAWPSQTVGIFFPDREGHARLRVWDSHRNSIHPGVTIEAGQGLLGQLIKAGGEERVLEPDLPRGSAGLGYYAEPEPIRSLAAVRVDISGRPGIALADHSESGMFNEATLRDLRTVGRIADHLLTRAARLRAEARQKEQLSSVGRFERSLVAAATEEEVETKTKSFLVEAMHADRVLFLELAPPAAADAARPRPSFTRQEGIVRWAMGDDAQSLAGTRFAVPGRGLASQALARGEMLSRRMHPHDPAVLLTATETPVALPEGGEFFCAPVPFGSDAPPGLLCAVTSDPSGFTAVQRDVFLTAASAAGMVLTRLRTLREQELLASRDGLTGLVNHRTFQASFRREIMRARRTGAKLAFFLTDIDFFKKVNDVHGHPAGDQVLKHVARIVSSQLRDNVDIVARYGGEEFACVLVETDPSAALENAERIRRAIEEAPCDIGTGQPLSVTLSMGVAVFPDDGQAAPDLIERADQALYRAKHGGRNRVERALGPGGAPPASGGPA